MWSAACIILIFTLNALSVRLFAEAEFWFASIKVFAICAFIVIGSLAIFGVIPVAGYQHAPMFVNLIKDGVFPQRLHAGVRHDSDRQLRVLRHRTHRRDRR